MKFNIKTRPKSLIDKHNNDTLCTVPLIKLEEHHNQTNKWFEDFEQELRQMLIQREEGLSEGNKLFVKGFQFALKEILGE